MIKLGVGEIPLENLCLWLNMRSYNKQMMIEYIKKYYEIDVTKEIDELHKSHKIIFDFGTNMQEKFNKEYKCSVKDDGTREWFNNYGRRKYERYMEKCLLFSGDFEDKFDEILDMQIDVVVHHIHPLQYGGTNDISNLISLNYYYHNILHKNPLEHIEKYCHQAVDYLRYLRRVKADYLNIKYNLDTYKEQPLFGFKVLNLAIENEMDLFYEKLMAKK